MVQQSLPRLWPSAFWAGGWSRKFRRSQLGKAAELMEHLLIDNRVNPLLSSRRLSRLDLARFRYASRSN